MIPLDVAMEFVKGINAHSIGKISELMTEDHQFTDALGNTMTGRGAMRGAWINYFYLVPDYRIAVENSFAEGNTVALFGYAEGTCRLGENLHPSNHWRIPAAWRAVVLGDTVQSWSVYADNEPVRAILARAE